LPLPPLLPYEWLAASCFALLAGAALVSRAPRRGRALGAAAACLAAVVGAGLLVPPDVRFWLAHAYLLGGYWLPPLLVVPRGGTRFEAWLVASDRAIRPRFPALPPSVAAATELAYLICYPLVPISFVVVWWQGTPSEVARFWLTTLASGYACYLTLPWLVSRPPRQREGDPAPRGVGVLNAFVLARVSHEWNTFPSGHVAVAWAAAWSVAQVSPSAGAVVALVAAAVAIGAAAGRYHYVVDVVAGVLVAGMAAVVTWWPAWI
jgi:membrane-associated phospholipid phosphatase